MKSIELTPKARTKAVAGTPNVTMGRNQRNFNWSQGLLRDLKLRAQGLQRCWQRGRRARP